MTDNHPRAICIYCGSTEGKGTVYAEAARRMGETLAKRGIRLVYGAGKTGLMGLLAEGVLQAGGEVTGVVCDNLNTPALIHANLTQLEVVRTIQQRKARMNELADAIVALPGGFGTFDELFEALTWAQIGMHQKPIGLLNVRGYFDPLLAMIDHALKEGFIYPEHQRLLIHAPDPETLLDKLSTFQLPSNLDRWLNR
jgi:uncharacterized protein (TIGR00730 family)